MKIQNQNEKGFTIIEVVLVLAIAGLIFLIVFLAVPALQRSQRDTQRRSDMGRFLSQITQYQANNGGEVPGAPATSNVTGTEIQDFIDDYLTVSGDTFSDPTTGETYVGHGSDNASGGGSQLGHIYYHANARCDAGGVVTEAGDRNIAVTTKLEGGGDFCQDNG